jgi:signal transduction histidine kinase
MRRPWARAGFFEVEGFNRNERGHSMRKLLLILLFAAISCLPGARSATAVATKRVLVLYSNSRLAPGNVAIDRGLSAALMSNTDHSVRIYSEFLDRPEFSGDAYEELVTSYLHGKYATSPPDAFVVVSDDAFTFIVRHRAQLFPGVPIVHAGVSTASLRTIDPLPADIVGVPNDYDAAGTITQALRWHPAARRLIIVTGASSRDRIVEARVRSEVPAVVGRITVEFWAALPVAVLVNRLRNLGSDAVVFTFGFFQDGDGIEFIPRDAAAIIARASSAPVYGSSDTYIGTGVVGGRMPSFEDIGKQAGEIVKALFAGTPPTSLRLPSVTPTALHIDWRQAQRWGISAAMIPAGAIVHFKPPTFWEAYRTATITALAIFFIQTVLIAALYFERRRRSVAELTTQELNTQLAHASRLAVAGELTAAIAHEINQPLGAVQANADAADMLLSSGADRREDLVRIVARIRHDIARASDVIRRLRTLLAKHEPERHPFDAGLAMTDVAMILRPEAERRKVTLDARSAPTSIHVAGDQTQIQQVLINLVLNAMDAVANLPESRRRVEVFVNRRDGNVLITVQDRGHGIAPEHLPKLFESFFSTKQRGMGLGLSIARSIVEAHGGRIWAETREVSGTTFHVELPAFIVAAVPLRSTI